ncbi:mobilization protein [Bacteroides fragilis]|nr:mobilization protein [Bacteroides fragilis]
MKQKGLEKLTCFLRVSPSVKYRLDTLNSGTQSNNAYISQMMEYFEVSGLTPQQITKQPIVQIQKRMEDVIKILRSPMKGIILSPDRETGIERPAEFAEDYARVMNELRDLKDENRKLKERLQADDLHTQDAAVYQDKLKRLGELMKYQLDPEKFPRIKYSDDVRVPVNTLQLLIKKINEEYVL